MWQFLRSVLRIPKRFQTLDSQWNQDKKSFSRSFYTSQTANINNLFLQERKINFTKKKKKKRHLIALDAKCSWPLEDGPACELNPRKNLKNITHGKNSRVNRKLMNCWKRTFPFAETHEHNTGAQKKNKKTKALRINTAATSLNTA